MGESTESRGEAAYKIVRAIDHRVEHGDVPTEVVLEIYCTDAVRKAYRALLTAVKPLRARMYDRWRIRQDLRAEKKSVQQGDIDSAARRRGWEELEARVKSLMGERLTPDRIAEMKVQVDKVLVAVRKDIGAG